MSRRLAKRGVAPSMILSSPWTRAWQTAGILAREVGLAKSAREATAALAQEPNLEALAAAVGSRTEDEVVALVGHEPWMGELASQLLTGSPSRLAIRFPKSAVLAVRTADLKPGAAQLAFFLTPRGS